MPPACAAPPVSASAADTSAPAPAPKLAIVPTLDAAKGASAVAAYEAHIRWACRDRAGAAAALRRVGHPVEEASVDELCRAPDHGAKALASGAFFAAGADEVLVQAESGNSWASGDQTLALLRRDRTKYQLVKHVSFAHGWSARARLTMPGGRDALFLCDELGHMGRYLGKCGFLGQGWLRERHPGHGLPTSDGTEIDTFLSWERGPTKAVVLGTVSVRGDDVHVELAIEDAVWNPEWKGDPTNRVTRGRRVFDMEYLLDEGRFRRTAPIPREVNAILATENAY